MAKQPNAPRPSPAVALAGRVEKALQQGQTAVGYDLARQLFRQSTDPAHHALARRAALAHADHFLHKDDLLEARSLMAEAAGWPGGDAAWLESLAERFAAAGSSAKAVELIDRVPGSAAKPRVLGRAADAALKAGGDRGRQMLLPELVAGYDAVRTAFGHYEAGRAEAAKLALEAVGLQSPFLEWKLLLRGLMAHAANDDARAVENWQRLSPQRLPARLAAPYRQAIDAKYREAMSPAARAAVQAQADKLLAGGLTGGLRAIQAALGREGGVPDAFRQAEALVPTLKRDRPELVGRLANCFYWSVVATGETADVNRYRKLFGAPADDPQLSRLQALLLEQFDDYAAAHHHWQMLELGIKAHPERWPAGQANRARAMLWLRMGRNAIRHLEEDDDPFEDFFAFAARRRGKRVPLKPPAEQCFRNAQELAPDWVEPYRLLFEHHRAENQLAKAEQVAAQVLERFPAELPALEGLADFYLENGKAAQALDLLRKAVGLNPLDRQLRARIGAVLLTRAAEQSAAAAFDEARAGFREALAYPENDRVTVLCAWSTCERKAGDAAKAEELQAQAAPAGAARLDVAFRLMVESARQRLGQKEKVRANKAFADALAEKPDGAAVADLLAAMRAYQLQKLEYHGRKTHEKKAMDCATAALKAKPDEGPLERIGRALAEQRWPKLMRECADQGRRRFKKNPYFPFLAAEALLAREGEYARPYPIVPLLKQARRLAEQSDRPDRQELLDAISERMRPFGMFENFWGYADEPDFI